MHCPNCGAEAPLTQKFCRSCGLGLEKIPQVFAEQFSQSDSEILSYQKTAKLQRTIEGWLSTAALGFVVLVALSVLAGITYLMVAGSLPVVPGIVILILGIAGLSAAGLATYSERLKRKLSDSSALNSATLSTNSITSRLPRQSNEGTSISVTEHTTKLLEPYEEIHTDLTK